MAAIENAIRAKIIVSCLAVILLVGCQTGQAPIGQGPITLAPQVSKYYKAKYLKNGPVVFFVSEDGGYATYVWCPQTAMCSTRGGAKWSAWSDCEEKSGKKCFIFDEDGSVVWEGAVSYDRPTTVSRNSRATNTKEHVRAKTDSNLCRLATDFVSGKRLWTQSENKLINASVNEARKRGLGIKECNEILGTADRSADSGGEKAPSTRAMLVCRKSTKVKDGKYVWDDSNSSEIKSFRLEAQDKGLTLQDCRKLLS